MPVSGFSVNYSAGPLVCCVLRRFVHATGCGKHLFVICIPHGVFFRKIVFARIISLLKTARDKANGHVGSSCSRWFVLYGLDRVGCLALLLGLCRCVDDLESK